MDDVMDHGPLSQDSMPRLRRRAWPLAVTVAFVVTGMAYSLFWAPVVRHHSYWITSGDVWSTYRSAHFIGWGYLGGIYSANTGLVTFPGILLVLAPVAMLTGALGLSESFPRFLYHPTAWYALGPYEMLMSTVALFACDALAERLGISAGRRVMLCLAEAAILWNVAVIWGHPEDAVSVGLAIYALVFALDGRWTGAGWLFGAALATQPLVLLMLPVLLALGGRPRLAGLTIRSLVPSVALLITPLISQFGATTHALLDQPNYPRIDHVTPWTALAPVLSGKGRDLAVAAGPGRVLALVFACCLGWWARRWRHEPDLIVLAAATALAFRCFTESVMVAFYIWPALAIGLVVAAHRGRIILALAAAAAIFTTAASQSHLGWLPWWSIVTAGIVIVLALGIARRHEPARSEANDRSRPIDVPGPPRVLVGALR